MGCPTKKEYEEALERKSYLCEWIRNEKKKRENLIEELCISQSCLHTYEATLSNSNEIIQKYEIYQEILAENNQ